MKRLGNENLDNQIKKVMCFKVVNNLKLGRFTLY